jgi:hypothetical protein
MGVHLDYTMVQITSGLSLWTTNLHYMWHNTIVILTVIYQFGIIHYVPVSQVSWRRGGWYGQWAKQSLLKASHVLSSHLPFFFFLCLVIIFAAI